MQVKYSENVTNVRSCLMHRYPEIPHVKSDQSKNN